VNGLQRWLRGGGAPVGTDRTTWGASELASAASVTRLTARDALLKAGAVKTRRADLPQVGHWCVVVLADIGWTTSNSAQSEHRYMYVGISAPLYFHLGLSQLEIAQVSRVCALCSRRRHEVKPHEIAPP
jgi:hypothetical protein